jgi:tyrosyl-tRNA synthetase
MSKSLNNYIGITDAANDMFGKIMSISDELMWRYYDLVSLKNPDQIQLLKQAMRNGQNPRDIKVTLALEIVERFHDKIAADNALQDFELRFKQGGIPDNLPIFKITATDNLTITHILKQANLVASVSEGSRMIDQMAVKINNNKVSDKSLTLTTNNEYIIQVGKRKFAKVIIK